MRVAIYAHDSYGLGHLRRSLVIANSLLELQPKTQVLILSGSPVAHLFQIPKGVRLVSLPPVVKVGVDEYRPLEVNMSLSLLIRARSAIIADAISRFRPDVFLVDHAPAGLKSELARAIEQVPEVMSQTRMVLGLRDIVDTPAATIELWRNSGVYPLLKNVYHDILIYGQQDIFDPISAYGLDEDIARKVRFTGYLGREDKDYGIPSESNSAPFSYDAPYILTTVGGGGDGNEVLKLALEASRELDIEVVACTGPLMDPTSSSEMADLARLHPRMKIVDFIPKMVDAMSKSVAVVSMGGYNSLCEALSAKKRPVVLPRVWPRREQEIRAELFSQRGLVEVISTDSPGVEGMRAALQRAINSPEPDLGRIDLAGLQRIAPAILFSQSPSLQGALLS